MSCFIPCLPFLNEWHLPSPMTQVRNLKSSFALSTHPAHPPLLLTLSLVSHIWPRLPSTTTSFVRAAVMSEWSFLPLLQLPYCISNPAGARGKSKYNHVTPPIKILHRTLLWSRSERESVFVMVCEALIWDPEAAPPCASHSGLLAVSQMQWADSWPLALAMACFGICPSLLT